MSRRILNADGRMKMNKLCRTKNFGTVKLSDERISCKSELIADVELYIRHQEKLVLRSVRWLITEDKLEHGYLGRHVLQSLGIDNRLLLSAARDRLGNSIDIPKLLKKRTAIDMPKSLSIRSILQASPTPFGSSFHSDVVDEDDDIDDNDVYVDLGEDTKEELDEALTELLYEAKCNGMSEGGLQRLAKIIKDYSSVFRIRLGKSEPAKVKPMRVQVDPKFQPIHVKVRRYSPQQQKFLDKYVETLKRAGMWIDYPGAEWQAAPLLVHKPNSKAKYRVTVDLRPVNAATILESWPMPNLESALNEFRGSSAFASIDFVSGYWQLPVARESWTKLGVVIPNGVPAATGTLPGMKNAAANFQRCVDRYFHI